MIFAVQGLRACVRACYYLLCTQNTRADRGQGGNDFDGLEISHRNPLKPLPVNIPPCPVIHYRLLALNDLFYLLDPDQWVITWLLQYGRIEKIKHNLFSLSLYPNTDPFVVEDDIKKAGGITFSYCSQYEEISPMFTSLPDPPKFTGSYPSHYGVTQYPEEIDGRHVLGCLSGLFLAAAVIVALLLLMSRGAI